MEKVIKKAKKKLSKYTSAAKHHLNLCCKKSNYPCNNTRVKKETEEETSRK